MFRIAQWVVRHKVLVVGVGCAFFIFAGGKKEEHKPANPWAANVPEQVASSGSASKDSLTAKAYGAVARVAKDYADVDIGSVNPAEMQRSTVENWSNAEAGMKKANGG